MMASNGAGDGIEERWGEKSCRRRTREERESSCVRRSENETKGVLHFGPPCE